MLLATIVLMLFSAICRVATLVAGRIGAARSKRVTGRE
jgi:hypothetical protein